MQHTILSFPRFCSQVHLLALSHMSFLSQCKIMYKSIFYFDYFVIIPLSKYITFVMDFPCMNPNCPLEILISNNGPLEIVISNVNLPLIAFSQSFIMHDLYAWFNSLNDQKLTSYFYAFHFIQISQISLLIICNYGNFN